MKPQSFSRRSNWAVLLATVFSVSLIQLPRLEGANVPPTIGYLNVTSSISENAAPTLHGAAISEFTVPTTNSFPNGIVVGPDGALWFTEYFANKIGRISTNGVITEFPVSLATNLVGITLGPDGRLWFVAYGNSKVLRMTTNGSVTSYPLTAGRAPSDITVGPDGALWFTETSTNIGRITTNGIITEFPLGTDNRSVGITTGPDNRLWYTDYFGHKIGCMTTSGVSTIFLLPPSNPTAITRGPDDALWFSEDFGYIGRITTNFVLTEFDVGEGSFPQGIITGPDGALWFAEFGSNSVSRITTDGQITRHGLAPNSRPLDIANGPDGAFWFTESGRNKIGRLAFTTVGNVLVSGSINNQDLNDPHTLVVNWGDGTPPETFNFGPGIASFHLTHQYLDDRPTGTASDTNTIHLVLTDDEGGSATNSVTVTVSNTAPVLSNINVSSPIVETRNATLSGAIADASPEDSFRLVVNWGDGAPPETNALPAGSTAFILTHRYEAPNPGYPINITLTDDDGGSALGSTSVTVQPRPRVQSITPLGNGRILMQFTGAPGQTYTIEASADLTSWMMIGMATANENGAFQFEDADAPSFSRRFYRVLVP